MQRSDTYSERAAAARCHILAAGLTALLAAGWPAPAGAKVFMTQEEALRSAFPAGVEPRRQTAFLTEEQAAAVQRAAGSPLPSKVITYYTGADRTVYFDTHLVRTLPETLMIAVTASGAIGRIEILSFSEPEDYLPRKGWMGQLEGKALDEDLSLRRGVRPISGATLTGRAVVEAARRILSIHAEIAKARPPEGAKP